MDYLLDSGILLRLVDAADPLHSDVRAAVETIQRRGDRPFMSLQNAAEFWNVSTRPPGTRSGYGVSVDETERRLRTLESTVNLLPDSPEAYAHWRRLVVAHAVLGVQVHDARLVALMAVHRVIHLLTLNAKDFRRYSDIVVVTPQDVITSAATPPPPATP